MDIVIDRTSRVPIYRQIVQRIRDMIVAGALPDGFRLPPERRLAQALGVNRTTVLNAYRELKATGLVDAHVGRGTTVRPTPAPSPAPRSAGESWSLPWRQLFHDRSPGRQDPLLRDLLQLTERPDVISLSIGLPDPGQLPLTSLRDLISDLVDDVGAAVFLHCPTEGHTPLRETIGHWVASRGIRCPTSEVLMLSGSQQGLDLTARILLEPGDQVVVEEPSYVGALQVFRGAGARLVSVPTDHDGMRTDILETILDRHRPKLIYTLPTYQNPSGEVLSLERRLHLLDLAYRHQIPILEDDPYSELRYDGESLPTLKALDRHDHVLYLSTFSKVLFPGLRLGFILAPRAAARQLVLAKQTVDLHASSLAQWLLDRFIRNGLYEPHLAALRQAYSKKRDAMAAALERYRVPGLQWRRPRGGFYFWCRLPDGVEESRLLTRAADSGVAYLPGWACFADDPPEAFARLNFTYPDLEHIREGVARFADAVVHASAASSAAPPGAANTPPIV